MKKILAIISIIVSSSTIASAEGTYIGYGVAKVAVSEPGYSYGSVNAIGLIGYDINPFFAIEAEMSFSLVKDTITISSTAIDLGVEHVAAFAKFTLPESTSIKPYARIGFVKAEASATVGSTTVSVNDTALAYGIGAEFPISETSGIRIDYSGAEFSGNADGGVLALTSVFRF